MAEWLGSGLQNRLQRFESARDLPNKALVIVCCKSFFILRIKITKFVGLEIKKAQIMGKALLFIAILSSFNLFAQMPASYGTSGATNNINAEVVSRFLFGSGNIAAPFSWSPVIPSGGTDITNPNSTGNNILPCRGYSDYSLETIILQMETQTMLNIGYSGAWSNVFYANCWSALFGSGWGVPFNTQRGVKVYIDFDQDGFLIPILKMFYH